MRGGEGPDTLTIAENQGLRRRLAEMIADRDRLASDLQATRAELERVRRNHLRRMLMSMHVVWDRMLISAKDEDEYYHKKRWRSERGNRLIEGIRAALAAMETGRA